MRAAIVFVIALFGACGTELVDGDTCADEAPHVTWENFTRGFTLARCNGCHSEKAPDRRGAPKGVVFDTADDARDLGAQIRNAVLVTKKMPPGGGVSESDVTLLDAWLRCNGN